MDGSKHIIKTLVGECVVLSLFGIDSRILMAFEIYEKLIFEYRNSDNLLHFLSAILRGTVLFKIYPRELLIFLVIFF